MPTRKALVWQFERQLGQRTALPCFTHVDAIHLDEDTIAVGIANQHSVAAAFVFSKNVPTHTEEGRQGPVGSEGKVCLRMQQLKVLHKKM